MEFETPKFRPKNPLGSGLTSSPNRGTQQGFSRFVRHGRKSARFENEANEIDFYPKILDLKFIIWTSKPQISSKKSLGKWVNQSPKQGYSATTALEKCGSWQRGKRDCFRSENCRFKVQYMDFQTPKISSKNSLGKWVNQCPKQGNSARFSADFIDCVGKVSELKTRQTRLFSIWKMQI